jgi:hypothetical protein
MTAWNKIKISKVWESREDQDVHASPKDARTEVPTVSTTSYIRGFIERCWMSTIHQFQISQRQLIFSCSWSRAEFKPENVKFSILTSTFEDGKKKASTKDSSSLPVKEIGVFSVWKFELE